MLRDGCTCFGTAGASGAGVGRLNLTGGRPFACAPAIRVRNGYHVDIEEEMMTESPPEQPDIGPEGPVEDDEPSTEPDGGRPGEDAPPPA